MSLKMHCLKCGWSGDKSASGEDFGCPNCGVKGFGCDYRQVYYDENGPNPYEVRFQKRQRERERWPGIRSWLASWMD